MIILITVTAGFALLTSKILYYEIMEEIRKIQKELEPIFKEGGVYPKAKPFEVVKLNRKMWVKPAPLYHVISK